jgi:ATP-dependent exoDNAse (exonuclease V) beta subunit
MKIFLHDPVKIESIESENTPNGDRVYKTPDGKLYPSVTTILNAHNKQGILEWRKRVGEEEANKISRQSATRGTKFHNLAEKYLQNQLPPEKLSILEHEMFEMAKPVLNRIDNIRAQEVGLWSHHLRLAGRVDCVGEFDGKLSIIDFKTARREKDEAHIQHYFMQASAYAIMFEERTKIPVNRLVIAIAVEDGFMQVFESKRNKHVDQLLYYRDLYEATK